MAKIKKACKGGLYPKSSSVSRRLKTGGSFPDLNKDGKIKKAQDGKKIDWGTTPPMKGLDFTKKSFKKRIDAAKSSYESSTNPKVEYNTPKRKTPGGTTGGTRVSVDTTGMSAGQRTFPAKVTTKSGKDVYYPINRSSAKRAVKYSQKNGGKTMKKCAYGCK